jgi:hypothetical protein
VEGPTGPGWIIELHGHHFYNDLETTSPPRAIGLVHVRQTLVRHLLEGVVRLPEGDFTMKELGIGYPIFVLNSTLQRTSIPNPYFQDDSGESRGGSFGVAGAAKDKKKDKKKAKEESVESWPAVRYDFIIQFVWQEKPLSVRMEARRKAEEEKAKAAGQTLPPPTIPSETPVTPPGEEAIKPEPMPEPEPVTDPTPEPGPEPMPEPEPEPMPEEPVPEPAEPMEDAAAAEKGAN